MTAAGEPWGWCEHCGDGTEDGDDPRPDLCAMCAKAGRGGHQPVDPAKQWPPPLEHKQVAHRWPTIRLGVCGCSPLGHLPGRVAWCYFRLGLNPGGFVVGPWS